MKPSGRRRAARLAAPLLLGVTLAAALGAAALGGTAVAAPAAKAVPALAAVAWQQRLGAAVPLQLRFSNDQGRVEPLSHYFRARRPVALVLMYLSCSRLCPLTLSLTQQAFTRAGLVPGRDFELLAVSIDPYDGVAAAARRKAAMAPPGPWQTGLQLLTAAPADRVHAHPASERLATAAGFGFLRNATIAAATGAQADNQFVHPAGWVLLDPSGHISRYFFGLQYDPATLREAVRAAGAQAPPTWSQPLRLLCNCLIALTGRYDAQVLDALRALCIALLGVGGWWLRRTLTPARASRRA
ncbi:MAG TPA: hypothetical protein VID71_05315 [Steroidobacteraceae bacterium]